MIDRETARLELNKLSSSDLEAVLCNHGSSSEYFIVAKQLLRERDDAVDARNIKYAKLTATLTIIITIMTAIILWYTMADHIFSKSS